MYGGRTRPKRMQSQVRVARITGTTTKGGASLPFITTGVPKRRGSLMLKIAGTTPARPTSRSCFDRAKSSISASARVVPEPPCQMNQTKNSWVNTCGGGCPALTAAMFSASAESHSGFTAASTDSTCTPTIHSALSMSTTSRTAASESPPCTKGRNRAEMPPTRSTPATCTRNHTTPMQIEVGSSAAKLRTTTSGAPPLSRIPQRRCAKKWITSTAKIAAAKEGNRPAAPSVDNPIATPRQRQRRRRARIDGDQPRARQIPGAQRGLRRQEPRQPRPGRLPQQQERAPHQDDRQRAHHSVPDGLQVRLLRQRVPDGVRPVPERARRGRGRRVRGVDRS